MKKWIFIMLFFVAPVFSEEKASLNTPLQIDPRAASELIIERVVLHWGQSVPESAVEITVSTGTFHRTFSYLGQTARDQMVTLNKANLSTNSLQKRIFNKLISDGLIDGTVTGNPD